MKIRHTTAIKNTITVALSCFLALMVSEDLKSQETEGDHNEQVTIVGSYDPTINQAYKINMKPESNTYSMDKPVFEFTTLDVKQDTKIEAGEITPATLRADKRVKVYDNFLKAGFGSLMSPFLTFDHSSGERNDYRFKANLYHLSTFTDVPDFAPSNFSNTDLGVSYDKYVGKSIVDFGVGYGLDTYRYYGFMPTDFPEINTDSDTLKQSFNQIRANVGVRSNNKKDDAFEYDADFSGYYYFDRWKTNQTDLRLDFDLGKPLDAGKKSNYQKVGIEGLFRFGVNADSVQSNTDFIVTGIPYYKVTFGMVSFSAGVDVSYLMADSSDFGVFPIINVNVNIVPDMLSIYAGTDGGFVKNSYFALTQVNPWTDPLVPITWQKNKIRAYAGLRGNISGQFGFNLELGWLSFDNMPFFINTTTLGDDIWPIAGPAIKFNTVNDNGSVFNVNAELTYTLGDMLKLWLTGSYDAYSLDSLAQPYHKPISVVSVGGSYLIKKKVNIWLEGFYYGKRYAIDITGPTMDEVELDSFFDLNVGIEYFATEKLTVFVTGTNLLNSNYERFLNYPVQGIQVMAGIGFRF